MLLPLDVAMTATLIAVAAVAAVVAAVVASVVLLVAPIAAATTAMQNARTLPLLLLLPPLTAVATTAVATTAVATTAVATTAADREAPRFEHLEALGDDHLEAPGEQGGSRSNRSENSSNMKPQQ